MNRGRELLAAPTPATLFPLTRQLSTRLTRVLLRLPVTPSQVTIVWIVVGLAGAAAFLIGGRIAALIGAVLLISTYVLDNCDGEVARAKRLVSPLGRRLDDLGGWLVHAAFFVAIGANAAQVGGHVIWLWLGAIAAIGATIDYLLISIITPAPEEEITNIADLPASEGWLDRVVFVFRALTKADCCFIVLALALFDAVWLLLPVAAVFKQVYWIAALYGSARRFHV